MCFLTAFHLLDIVYRSEALKNVLASVTHNGRQLLMTAVLMMFVVYVYSIVGFSKFRDDYVVDASTSGGVRGPINPIVSG